ncbi:hypothetical protein KC19_9G059900 [Ceratodon purpureus]|uniref:Uncharacterized protein n=1 Tax=Ceratodon purpureus TaxID=3225 RepID=A0A8T0GSH8_CERPU|nr:hypothetical protein KC19_9G059900 [Ceratodon purpureus]
MCPSLNSCSAHSLSHSQPHSTINQSPNPYLPANSHTSTALSLISQLTYNSLLFTPSSLLSSTSSTLNPQLWISYGGRASAFSQWLLLRSFWCWRASRCRSRNRWV